MKILVIGGGGREHAIVRKLNESPRRPEIYVAPGNGGIAREAHCVPIAATDIDALVAYAVEHAIDYAVVGPDDPLVLGAVDALAEAGIPSFGPTKAAARLEGSKAFAKDFMKRHDIPTAMSRTFDDEAQALKFLQTAPMPIVVKADGLALGKGVTIATTREEARTAVRESMSEGRFGASGHRIVIEEFLVGPEVSVLAFCDGQTIKPMVPAADHKRVGDGDTGPNTGGMGAVAPIAMYTEELAKECMRTIFEPTVRGMSAEGMPFKGCLYVGLMLTQDGPRVIEYNCRFGDPETQVVLELLQSDLLDIMEATTNGTLAQTRVEFSDGGAACIIMASGGYPGPIECDHPIDIPQDIVSRVRVAGARNDAGSLVTAGGRVLGVVGTAPTLDEAVDLAYADIARITFKDAHYRTDIGAQHIQRATPIPTAPLEEDAPGQGGPVLVEEIRN